MRRLFFICFLGSFHLHAQTHLPDSTWTGHYIFYGIDRPDAHIPDSGKVEEGDYIKGRKEGVWTKYHKDGVTPKLIGEYKKNRPSGSYAKYFESGQIKEKGTFEKGADQVPFTRWNENGKISFESFYVDSTKSKVRVNSYYTTGELEYYYVRENGKNTGQCFNRDGSIRQTIPEQRDCWLGERDYVFAQTPKDASATTTIVRPSPSISQPDPNKHPPLPGDAPKTNSIPYKPNAYNKIYNQDNEIWLDGVFKDGKLWDGKVYVYDRDGILLKVELYKNNSYFADGQL